MKTPIIIVVGLLIIGAIVFFFTLGSKTSVTNEQEPTDTIPTDTTEVVAVEEEEAAEVELEQKPIEKIGTSVGGDAITAYHYGEGTDELLFVGGIHGGYAWNTSLVAFELMDYLTENPSVIPNNVMVTVIPILNPDGLSAVVGKAGRFTSSNIPSAKRDGAPNSVGRFNGNNVDLNRNFDCEWQSEGTWQNRTVSGGDESFSEPESQAIRDYVEKHDLTAVVVYYSAAGGVFASSCHNGISTETLTITNVYADASRYKAYEEFDFYEVTGDMVNWLAGNDIPAISVLLTTHGEVEWEKNRAGIEALLEYYAR